jgi:protease PrsW
VRRSPYFLALIVLLVSLVLGLLVPKFVGRNRGIDETAAALLQDGRPDAAEALYWNLLRAEPTVPHVVMFLDAHMLAARMSDILRDDRDEPSRDFHSRMRKGAAVTEDAIDVFLARADLPPDVALLGTFCRKARAKVPDPALRANVVHAANASPPMPWANRLLAAEAERAGDLDAAATLYLREGRYVSSNTHDVNHALALLMQIKDWDAISVALADPVVERAASLMVKARWGAETNRWRSVLLWILKSIYVRPAGGPLALTTIAAFAWWFFVAQLGKVGERIAFRVALFLSAFALGTLSIGVTDFLILVEESKLHLVETGEPVRDFIFFTVGVGLREELSKLLLFLPLVPILRAKGKPLDVLVSGACVGLGFAAMENIGYLSSRDLATGLGRFLTANFLHMAMTAILAGATFDFAKHGDEHATAFSKTALRVIAMHGAYDFFITHPQIGGGYLAMTVFFVLVNQFLAVVNVARGRASPNEALLRTFMVGTATVAGASFVWASYLVGPAGAVHAIVPGLLGNAIILYAFGQRFQRM